MFSCHYTFACTVVYLWRICMFSPYPPNTPLDFFSWLKNEGSAQMLSSLRSLSQLPFTHLICTPRLFEASVFLLYPVLTLSITLYHKLFTSLSLSTLPYLKTGNMFFKLGVPTMTVSDIQEINLLFKNNEISTINFIQFAAKIYNSRY